MHPNDADFEQSIRRSPARERVLVALCSLSVSYPRPLAQAARVDFCRLKWIMHGHPPRYKLERSLLHLGLARVVHGANGVGYEITPRGRRKARQLTSRIVRDDVRRRAWKKVLDDPALPAGAPAPAASDAVGCTYTCTTFIPPPPVPRP